MIIKIEYPTGNSTTFNGRTLTQEGLLTFFVNQAFRSQVGAESILIQFDRM